MLWQVCHLWCLFYPSFYPFWVSVSPSVLPHWAVLLRLKYWSLLQLTLSWQSICHMESPEKPVYFLSIKFRWPFLFYFFSVFAATFYDLEDKKNKALLERFLCYIHCYLVCELKQPFNRVKLHHNLIPSFTQDLWSCRSAVVTIEVLLTSLSETSFSQVAHFVSAGKSPGHSKVIFFIIQTWYTPDSDTHLKHCTFQLCQSIVIWNHF